MTNQQTANLPQWYLDKLKAAKEYLGTRYTLAKDSTFKYKKA